MRLLAFSTALVIVILTGLANGNLTGRWNASRELRGAVSRLDAIPRTVGDWRSVDFGLDPKQVEIGEIAGYVARRYEDPAGVGFTVMLLCGRPGPIAAHTPEWCYGGAGYNTKESPWLEPLEVEKGRHAAFWVNTFHKKRAAVPEDLEICWSWNVGKGWQAPENARLAFATHRFLYKLYVVRDTSADSNGDVEVEARREFIRQLIPSVDAALFGRINA